MKKIFNWLQQLNSEVEQQTPKEIKEKKSMEGLKPEDYEKYILASASRVTSLDNLSRFGITPNRAWSNQDEAVGYMSRSFINGEEEKVVGVNDWKYRINKYNFREPWDLTATNPKLGFFGCSFTFGEGIEYKDTFVNLVSENFNVTPFNFGVGGSSVQRVVRTFSAVTKVIDLDYAIFTLPHWHRQMYLDSTGKIINLIPHWPHMQFLEISNQLTDLEEDFYVVQAVSFVSWIRDIAEARGIKIILSSWDYPLNDLCKAMYPDVTIETFPNIDDKCARDNIHPGTKSQKAHAEQIIKAINDRAWLQKL